MIPIGSPGKEGLSNFSGRQDCPPSNLVFITIRGPQAHPDRRGRPPHTACPTTHFYAPRVAPAVEGRLMRGEQGLDVGDQIRVKLLNTDPVRGFIDFGRA